MSTLFFGGLSFLKKFSRTCKQKLAPTQVVQHWRSFQLSGIKSSDDPIEEEVNIQKIIEQFEQKVDESKLSHDEANIHAAHIKALKVRCVLLYIIICMSGEFT